MRLKDPSVFGKWKISELSNFEDKYALRKVNLYGWYICKIKKLQTKFDECSEYHYPATAQIVKLKRKIFSKADIRFEKKSKELKNVFLMFEILLLWETK